MTDTDTHQEAADWWRTEIIDMSPGEIRYRGYPVEDLIGNIGLAQMIWLMLRGELPNRQQADLLETALMSAVDHGPQAPGIAIARMAATCGVGLNNAMASGLNVLGDVHGGAGEQAVVLYDEAVALMDEAVDADCAAARVLDAFLADDGKYVPGFGHRFHPVDPRVAALLNAVDIAVEQKVIAGRHAAVARAMERRIESQKDRHIPMNIDGATAVIYAELGFPAPLARGLFCLSRSVGILAHAWEQTCQGGRNKGPIPRDTIWTYDGPAKRVVPTDT
ncbi:MAG: citryl-CoA lyase [Acidiferrobacterales bacterium]|nr:citryl-CoA lyase [Acidiferrobacterales bacterium]